MTNVDTIMWLGVVTIGSTALCAMSNMLLHEYEYRSAFMKTVVPTVIVGLFGILVLLYVSFVA
jgi:hypothetical protein